MKYTELTVAFNPSVAADINTKSVAVAVKDALLKKYELAYFQADADKFIVVLSEDVDVNSVSLLISDVIISKCDPVLGINSYKISHRDIDNSRLVQLQMSKPKETVDKSSDADIPSSQAEPVISKEASAPADDGSVPISDFVRKANAEAPAVELSAEQLEELREKAVAERVEKAKSTNTLKKIRGLIGAEEFKSLADEISLVAPVIAKKETYDVLTSRAYLFSIGDGNGLTAYLNLFADLFEELGLFRFDSQQRIIEHTIAPNEPGRQPFKEAMDCFKCFSEKSGRLVCLDISEWMTQCNSKDFREFLAELSDVVGKHLVVFRVPFLEKDVVSNLNAIFNDRLCMRQLTFLPFDNNELISCARKTVTEYGFDVDEDVWDVFNARITEEKNDGRFYGIETVKKIVREMIYLKELSCAMSGSDNTLIKKDEILNLSSTYNGDADTGLAVLDSMVGMADIKQRVVEITSQIEMAMKNDKLDRPCIHMRFVGSPGTGKTTVARVLGQILKEKGILRNGSFFEHAGREFCGRYVGETSPKTASMCRDAYGSVLFIDEAYTLFRNEGVSSADYGREAIDTLISEMENHRTDLVVIMAGYPDEMNNLMKANPGLESRMPYIINFPNYTREQLTEIFMRLANKAFTCGEGFAEAVSEFFSAISDDVLESKDFSNARFVRNLFERTWGKSVLRAQLGNKDEIVLEKEDFISASSDKEFTNLLGKKKSSLGFI